MEIKKTKDVGEFIMLAVHSKASFVMSLEHQKTYKDRDESNRLNFLEKMKEIEDQKNKGDASSDNKR